MEPTREDALRAHSALLDQYGDRPWHPRGPIATLVSTIISQNTNDTNRDRAFERLRERFPRWDQVRDAPEAAVVEAIRLAGLGPTKAPRIQAALRRITEREGEITLDFLRDMSAEEARNWLTELPGVGPKTAAIVLCFALGKPAFPVDTHVHRVSRRLGLIPEGTSREKAHDILEDVVPEEIYYPFHLNLIAHGRAICHSRNPECERCVLREACDHYASTVVVESAA
ncbi:MAG: endonuclease III [Chloroflexota bacterium]|nr:endonuclease III [Chloroflexota bacterium]